MKKILLATVLFFMVSVGTASAAEYSIAFIKDGVTLNTQPITTAQIQDLQKATSLTGKSVINQIKGAILGLIARAESNNATKWKKDNDAYIKEQARQ